MPPASNASKWKLRSSNEAAEEPSSSDAGDAKIGSTSPVMPSSSAASVSSAHGTWGDRDNCDSPQRQSVSSSSAAVHNASKLLNLNLDEALVALDLTRQQRTQLSSELNAFRKTIDELKEQKSQLTVELTRRLQTHKEDLETAQSLQREISQLRSVYGDKQAENIELSSKIQDIMQQLEATEQQRELKEENELLWRRVEELKQTLESARGLGSSDGYEQMKENVRDLEALIIDTYTAKNPGSEESMSGNGKANILAMLETILLGEEKSRRVLSNQVANLRQKLQEARDVASAHARNMVDLETEKEKMSFQLSRLEDQRVRGEREGTGEREQVKELQTRLNTLRSQLADEEEAKKMVETELEKVRSSVQKEVKELQVAKKVVEAELETVRSSVQKEVKEQLQAAKTVLEGVCEEKEVAIRELRLEMEGLAAQHKEAIEKLAEEKSDAIEEAKRNHEAELKTMECEFEKSRHLAADDSTVVEELKDSIAELRAKLKETHETKEREAKETAEAHAKIAKESSMRHNAKINLFTKQIADLKSTIGSLSEKSKAQETELEKLRAEQSAMASEPEESKEEMETLKSELAEQSEKCQVLEDKLESLEAERENWTDSRLTKEEAENQKLRDLIEDARQMRVDLEERLKASELTTRELEDKIEDIMSQRVAGGGGGEEQDEEDGVFKEKVAELEKTVCELQDTIKELKSQQGSTEQQRKESSESENEDNTQELVEKEIEELKTLIQKYEREKTLIDSKVEELAKEIQLSLDQKVASERAYVAEIEFLKGQVGRVPTMSEKAYAAQNEALKRKLGKLSMSPFELLMSLEDSELKEKFEKAQSSLSLEDKVKHLSIELAKFATGKKTEKKDESSTGVISGELQIQLSRLSVENDSLKAQIKKVEEGWRAEYTEYQTNLGRVRSQLEKLTAEKTKTEEAIKLETQQRRLAESARRALEKTIEIQKATAAAEVAKPKSESKVPSSSTTSSVAVSPRGKGAAYDGESTAATSPMGDKGKSQKQLTNSAAELAKAKKELAEMKALYTAQIESSKSAQLQSSQFPILNSMPQFLALTGTCVSAVVALTSLYQLSA